MLPETLNPLIYLHFNQRIHPHPRSSLRTLCFFFFLFYALLYTQSPLTMHNGAALGNNGNSECTCNACTPPTAPCGFRIVRYPYMPLMLAGTGRPAKALVNTTLVSFVGTNFGAGDATFVNIGGVPCDIVTQSQTAITCRTPMCIGTRQSILTMLVYCCSVDPLNQRCV